MEINSKESFEDIKRKSKEQVRLMIESAAEYAIFTLDIQRNVITWSKGAEAIIGYTEQEMIGQSGDIIFTPEDREAQAPEQEAETAAKQGRAENERWHIRKEGSRFWGSGVTSPIPDNDGKVTAYVKIMRDLTKRKQLEESRFFLASIVETSSDSIVTIDLERRITSWNKAAEKLYGYPANEAIGKNLTLLIRDEDFALIVDMVDKIEHRKKVEVFETVRTTKDGRQLDLQIVMSPVMNASGQIIGISTIARDITDRKRRELNAAFLADVNTGFAPFLTVDELMGLVGERLADYLQLSLCHISLVNEETDTLKVIYEWRRDQSSRSLLGVSGISDMITPEGRQYYGTGKVAVINVLEDNRLLNTSKWRELHGFSSIIEVPKLQDGQ